jgi:hypothetical protein
MKNITRHLGTAAFDCLVEQSSTRSLHRVPFKRLKSCARIFFATLHEIFEESAYARFLERKRLVSSRTAYAAFRQENEAAWARRPRCC